jgi:tryptophan synthase beta chain
MYYGYAGTILRINLSNRKVTREPLDLKLAETYVGGRGLTSGEHAASLSAGSPGILHGTRSFVLQDEDGQIVGTHSISAGLDYPGVGPEHADLQARGRARYVAATDDEAVRAFKMLCETEGIIPALEPAHALAHVADHAADFAGALVLVILSGRGDKDIHSYARATGTVLEALG